MSAPSFAGFVRARPWLHKALQPIANWYVNAAAYRQLGLRADDLISEEDETVLKALKRLDAKESYDRIYRMRRATQLSLQQKILPKAEWTKPEEDTPYLEPLIAEIIAEQKERAALDNLEIIKNH